MLLEASRKASEATGTHTRREKGGEGEKGYREGERGGRERDSVCVAAGKGEKAGATLQQQQQRGRKGEVDKEEEEFAVSASREGELGQPPAGKKGKRGYVGKSKKRQFKVK